MQTAVFFEVFSYLMPIILFLKFSRSKKLETIALIFIVGFLFGLVWEPLGTDFTWQYPGFYFYYFSNQDCYVLRFNLKCYGIPLAIPIGWGWMMVLTCLLSQKLMNFFKNKLRNRLITFFISGLITGGILEFIAVYQKWWVYIFESVSVAYTQELIYIVGATVTIGWGIISYLNLFISTILYPDLKKKYNPFFVLIFVLLLALLNGFIAWQLIRYGVFPMLKYGIGL